MHTFCDSRFYQTFWFATTECTNRNTSDCWCSRTCCLQALLPLTSGGDIPDQELERDDRERDGRRREGVHVGLGQERGRAVVLVGRQRGQVHRAHRAVARAVALGVAPAGLEGAAARHHRRADKGGAVAVAGGVYAPALRGQAALLAEVRVRVRVRGRG